MADPKNPKGPEVKVPAAPEAVPEVAPESHTAQRIEVAGAVTEQKSKEYLNLEKLKRGDFEIQIQEPEIRQINIRESAEKQRPLMEELAGTAMFELVPHLLFKGIPAEQIRNFDVFRNPPPNLEQFLTVKNPQGTLDLKAAFTKIQEALNGPNGADTVRGILEANWNMIVTKAQEAYEIMKPYLQEAQDSGRRKKRPEKKEKGFFEKYGSGILIGLGLIAGAYVCTSIWHKFTATDEEKAADAAKAPSGFFGKLFKGIAGVGIIGAIFAGLGRLVEADRVRGWLRKFGFDDAKLIEAVRLLWHGKFGEAWEKFKDLFSENPEKSSYEKIAEKINKTVKKAEVTGTSIQKIIDVKYRDWFPQDLTGKITKGARDMARSVIEKGTDQLGFIGNFIGDDKLKADMAMIEKFILLPENQEKINKINPGPRTTMKTILEKLCEVTEEDDEETVIPEAAAVTAAGAVGAAAKEAGAEKQREIQTHKTQVVQSIETEKKLTPATAEIITEDLDAFNGLLESSEETGRGWWQREKDYFQEFMNNIPDKHYDDQDFIALLDELEEADGMIVQKLRTQVGTIRDHMLAVQNGQMSIDAFKQEVDDFYTQYYDFQAKLDEVNQRRIQEEEAQNKQFRNKAWYAKQDWTAGVQLMANTFFGMPYSVVVQREENGNIVTFVGYASVATALAGFGKGFFSTGGSFGKGLLHGAWGLSAPPRYLTGQGLVKAKHAVEKLQFWKTSALMREVQEGRLTIEEGMRRMQEYLEGYGREFVNGEIKKMDGTPSLRRRVKSFWRKENLSDGEIKALRQHMEQLDELGKKGCKTWEEAITAGRVTRPAVAAAEAVAEFTAHEEQIIARKTQELVDGGSRPSTPKEAERLRRWAIAALQEEGKLRSVEEMGTTMKGLLEGKAFEKLPASEKIAALQQASREADLYLEKAVLEVSQMRAKVPPVPEEEIKHFVEAVQENLKQLRTKFNTSFSTVKGLQKSMSREEHAAFGHLVTEELAHAKGIRGVMREVKGRGKFALVFGVANIVLETYAVTKEQKESHVERELLSIASEIGLDTLQLVLDVLCPFGISDWYTVFTGKEALTGRDATVGERITRGVFGTWNLATDTLAALGAGVTAEVGGAGGAAVYGVENAVEVAIRGAGKAPRIIAAVKNILPRLIVLAKDVGGFKRLLEIVRKEKIITALQRTAQVSKYATYGIMAVELSRAAFAGYEILFDTKDQPVHEFALDTELEQTAQMRQAA